MTIEHLSINSSTDNIALINNYLEEVNGKYIVKCPVTSSQLLQLTKTALIKESRSKIKISDSQAAVDYLIPYLSGLENEIFVALFLNNKNALIAAETLEIGSVHHSAIHPRKLIRAALKHNASSVIVSHNHPSGDITPSKADLKLTKKLKPILEAIDVRLVDHIIVGSGNASSIMKEDLI